MNYSDDTYSGAPDECSIHWPTKLVNGQCAKCNTHPDSFTMPVYHKSSDMFGMANPNVHVANGEAYLFVELPSHHQYILVSDLDFDIDLT